MAIEWKGSYSVLIEEIDDQHKKLFEIGNRLYTIASEDQMEIHMDLVNYLMEELKNYTINHFAYEENLLLKNGYSLIEKHKMEHLDFVHQIQKFNVVKMDVCTKNDLLEIIMFIINWISKHIMISDKQYSKDFLTKGIIGNDIEKMKLNHVN